VAVAERTTHAHLERRARRRSRSAVSASEPGRNSRLPAACSCSALTFL